MASNSEESVIIIEKFENFFSQNGAGGAFVFNGSNCALLMFGSIHHAVGQNPVYLMLIEDLDGPQILFCPDFSWKTAL